MYSDARIDNERNAHRGVLASLQSQKCCHRQRKDFNVVALFPFVQNAGSLDYRPCDMFQFVDAVIGWVHFVVLCITSNQLVTRLGDRIDASLAILNSCLCNGHEIQYWIPASTALIA